MDNLGLEEKMKLLQALKDKADAGDIGMGQPVPVTDMTPEKAAELDAQAVRGPASVEVPMDPTLLPLQPKGAFIAKPGMVGQEASPDVTNPEEIAAKVNRFAKMQELLKKK
jgi:hypothetical protein